MTPVPFRQEQLGKVNVRLEKDIDLQRQAKLVDTLCTSMMQHSDLPNNIVSEKRGKHTLLPNKLPDKYKIDYLITTDFGKQLAFVECKWYMKGWTTIPDQTIKLSLLKVKDLLNWAELTKTKPFFAVRMRDGFYYWMPTRHLLSRATVTMGGRTDRGYAGDIEPMVHVHEVHWDCFYVGQVDV